MRSSCGGDVAGRRGFVLPLCGQRDVAGRRRRIPRCVTSRMWSSCRADERRRPGAQASSRATPHRRRAARLARAASSSSSMASWSCAASMTRRWAGGHASSSASSRDVAPSVAGRTTDRSRGPALEVDRPRSGRAPRPRRRSHRIRFRWRPPAGQPRPARVRLRGRARGPPGRTRRSAWRCRRRTPRRRDRSTRARASSMSDRVDATMWSPRTPSARASSRATASATTSVSPASCSVHEPLGELELGVQTGALAQQRVGGAHPGRRVAVVHVVGRGRGGREPRRSTAGSPTLRPDQSRMPLTCGTPSASSTSRIDALVAPPRMTADSKRHRSDSRSARRQRIINPSGTRARGIRPIQEASDVVADLLGSADRQSIRAHDRDGERVHGGQRGADRGGVPGPLGSSAGVDAVPVDDIDHENAVHTGSALARPPRAPEGQESPHTRRSGHATPAIRRRGRPRRPRPPASARRPCVRLRARAARSRTGGCVLGERGRARHADSGKGRRRGRG